MRTTAHRCDCARTFRVVVGRPTEYRRVKTLLNAAKFPTFIGRDLVSRCARNGGVIFYVVDDVDIAVSILNPRTHVWLVLAVHPTHHDHGMGTAMLHYLRPLWIRSTEAMVPYFEARGYVKVGEPKHGKSLTTWILAQGELFSLAGRLSRLAPDRCRCSENGAQPTGADAHHIDHAPPRRAEHPVHPPLRIVAP
jgi:hypothetical protein